MTRVKRQYPNGAIAEYTYLISFWRIISKLHNNVGTQSYHFKLPIYHLHKFVSDRIECSNTRHDVMSNKVKWQFPSDKWTVQPLPRDYLINRLLAPFLYFLNEIKLIYIVLLALVLLYRFIRHYMIVPKIHFLSGCWLVKWKVSPSFFLGGNYFQTCIAALYLSLESKIRKKKVSKQLHVIFSCNLDCSFRVGSCKRSCSSLKLLLIRSNSFRLGSV